LRIDPATLDQKHKLIEPASRGSYSKPVETGRDAGGTELIAYLFDPATGVYRRIQLAVSGNKKFDNLSASAKNPFALAGIAEFKGKPGVRATLSRRCMDHQNKE
jgi:hypothetical protein